MYKPKEDSQLSTREQLALNYLHNPKEDGTMRTFEEVGGIVGMTLQEIVDLELKVRGTKPLN